MNSFLHALAFLTRFPVPKLNDSKEDWLRSPAYYPAVGALIGLALWGIASAATHLFSALLAAVFTLAGWVFITGGLHLDGWMDTADGLGSNRSTDEMLAVMKDSRVGAMGVLAAVLLLMAKAAALHELFRTGSLLYVILPPVIARFCLVAAMRMWPYLSEKGIGAGMGAKLHAGKLAAGLLFCAVVCFLVGGLGAIFLFVLACIAGLAMGVSLNRRFGGLTGDGYGAIVEWTELAALLFILMI